MTYTCSIDTHLYLEYNLVVLLRGCEAFLAVAVSVLLPLNGDVVTHASDLFGNGEKLHPRASIGHYPVKQIV
jgi:hypothetical protein